jgi:hypothetical protein
MECNVGGVDWALRSAALAATLVVGISARLTPPWRAAIWTLAGMEAFTVLTRYCPLNAALGINTCRRQAADSLSGSASSGGTGEYLGERRPEHYAG